MSQLVSTQVLSDEDSSHTDPIEDKYSYLIVNDTWHEILKGETRIGRDESQCSIVLADDTISKIHAVIESEGPDDTFIYDVGSMNKTKIKKMKLKPQCRYKINDNDIITLGKITVKFKIVDEKYGKCKPRSPEVSGEVKWIKPFDKTGSQAGTSKSEITSICKTEENSQLFSQARVSLKEIVKTPKKYYYTLASEFLNSNVFDQLTQCEAPERKLNNTQLKHSNNYLNNSEDDDDDIYNMSTQIEFSKDSHEPHELISDLKMKNESNSSFERVFNSYLHDSSTFGFVKENDVPVKEVETHKSSGRDISHCSDIYDLSTQCENPQNCVASNGPIRELKSDQDINNKCVERVGKSYFDELNVKNNEGKLYNPTKMCISLSDDLFDLATQNNIKLGNSQIGNEDMDKKNRFTSNLETKSEESVMKKISVKNCDSKLLSDGEDEQLCELMRVTSQKIPSNDGSNPCDESLLNNVLARGKAPEEIFDVQTQINSPTDDVECRPRVVQDKTDEKLDLKIDGSSQSLFLAISKDNVEDSEESRKKCTLNEKDSKKLQFSLCDKGKRENFNARRVSEEDLSDDESRSTSGEKVTERVAHDTQLHGNEEVECSVSDRGGERQMRNKDDEIISQTSFKIGSSISPEEQDRNIRKIVDCQSDKGESIDSGDETESDLETKLGLNKTETPSGNSNKNSGKGNDNIDFAHLSDRRSSSSSDRTLSDLDVINELRNSESLLDSDIMEDFIPTQEFLFGNKRRSESASKTDSGLEVDQAGTKIGLTCEDFVSNDMLPPCKGVNRRSTSESSDKTASDLEEGPIVRPLSKVGDYDIVDISSAEDVYDIEEASTESESLIKKEIEDGSDVEGKKISGKFGRCESPVLLPFKQGNDARADQNEEGEDFVADSDETDCDEELVAKKIEVFPSTSTTDLGEKEDGKDGRKENDEINEKKMEEIFDIGCDYISGSPSKRTRITKWGDIVPKKRSKTSSSGSSQLPEAEPKNGANGKCEQNACTGMNSENVNSEAGKKGVKEGGRTSARLRKNKTDGKLKMSSSAIVFTGFESEIHNRIISNLGGSRVNDLVQANVLVTDRVKRTVKFLSALALGMPIVSPKWLVLSEKEGEFLDPWEHLLQDGPSEERWHFNLKSSLEKWKKRKLLSGFTVYATDSTKPPIPEILSIVKCCGGIPLTSCPEIWPKKSLVLTCFEDRESWPSPKFKHVKIVHYEFLLSGVLTYFLDFKTYKLR